MSLNTSDAYFICCRMFFSHFSLRFRAKLDQVEGYLFYAFSLSVSHTDSHTEKKRLRVTEREIERENACM
jgi:hypothetical protein